LKVTDRDRRARIRLAAQNGAVRALVQSESSADAVRGLLREVCESLGWTMGEFWTPDPDDRVLCLSAEWSDPRADVAAFVDAGRRVNFERGVGLPGRVWAALEPAWIDDVAQDSNFPRRESARPDGLHGAFAVPVPLGEGRHGVLEFFTRQPEPADPELLETMMTVVGYLGEFLQRRRAEERQRFQARILDAVGEAVIATDLDGRILYWNAFAEHLYGWRSEEVLGREVTEVTPAVEARPQAQEIMDRLSRGGAYSGEFVVRDRDGREFPVIVNNSPILDDEAHVIGVIGTSIDITERKRREEGQRFLSEASRVLASSLNYATTLRSVATLAIPHFGDWCLVHLRGGDGRITPVARVVPEADAGAADLLERLLSDESGLTESIMDRDSALLIPSDEAAPELSEERLGEAGVVSLLAVPIRARGNSMGVMTFAISRGERRHDSVDAGFAEELGRRAGLAIDNARLYRDAEEGNRAKADFLAVVSHELRTPLNAIAGYADLLAGGIAGDLNEGQQRHVERIKVGAGHLAHLIDEVLTFARVESGRERVRLETVDLGRLAREAAMVLEPDAADKGLALHVDAPEQGLTLKTDPGKVRQIMVNLLSNAVKYSEEGEVRLSARAVTGGAEFQVSDTGMGIPIEAQERIFEPFWQAESPNTRSVGGTGLGLSVSRRLARLLDGDISVQSEPGAGSTFTVLIADMTDTRGA
jgi:PAS domain S-box-containing protein